MPGTAAAVEAKAAVPAVRAPGRERMTNSALDAPPRCGTAPRTSKLRDGQRRSTPDLPRAGRGEDQGQRPGAGVAALRRAAGPRMARPDTRPTANPRPAAVTPTRTASLWGPGSRAPATAAPAALEIRCRGRGPSLRGGAITGGRGPGPERERPRRETGCEAAVPPRRPSRLSGASGTVSGPAPATSGAPCSHAPTW